ncbi:MAG: ABC transporter substrate-binding protein [Gemmataceae bacterium]
MTLRGWLCALFVLLAPGLSLGQEPKILYVGVQQLPEFLSPATACTNAEQQAIELLFQALVRAEQEPGIGQRYYPELAAELPAVVPLGREYRLADAAKWSDGNRVLAVDVRHTVDLLRAARRAPLIDEARVGKDAYHVTLALEKTYFDPLSVMSFKVLPRGLARLDDEKFARSPVGSGPYTFAGKSKDKKREIVRFVASKHYPWPLGKPGIDEIRFYVPKDASADLARGTLHLVLDAEVEGDEVLRLPARRVFFLAVNQRRPFLQNRALRRCLALAIDRAAIVKSVFGDSKGNRALNGPFLGDSWAANPELAPLFNAASAAALAVKAKESLGGNTLSLKYPEGDGRIERACQAIRDQVKEHTGIELKLLPLPAHQLRADMVDKHDYDLAYWHHDYVNEACVAWPLFDPAAMGPGGSNFLGVNDSDIRQQFAVMHGTREFRRVQAAARLIHDLVHERLPLIPLWQLDMAVAISPRVKTFPEPARLDPLRIFQHVDRWSLSR